MSQEDYVRDRLDDQIRWYGDKAGWNQRWFRRLQLAQIGLGALIPFSSGAAAALLSENWVSYRGTAEALKREKAFFQAGVEPYNGPEAFELLVKRSEELMSSESTRWTAIQEGEQAEGQ